MLQLVLQNILMNAAQAMAGQGVNRGENYDGWRGMPR
jgi:hypothetical protein